MKESLIEAAGVRYAQERGWTVYKWSSPGNRGILDRIHFKSSAAFAIEYKTTGKKATPKQKAEAERLQAAGIPARCIDNVTDARVFINIMTDIADPDNGSPFLVMSVLAKDNLRSFEP